MRNPDRLDAFYDELRDIHKRSFPDWRFGQLMCNFFGWLYQKKGLDVFFPEEKEMITYIRLFEKGESNERNIS